jgi:curved DNA-binding protein CbpA
MIDCFSLFAQPRQPWLEENVLKEKHHELTRHAHPDVCGHEVPGKFEEINEAYRILSEPKLRIQHLLQLEGEISPPRDRPIPSDLQELFLQIGTLCQTTRRVFAQIGNGSAALARSLAKTDLLRLERETRELLEQLSQSYNDCLADLRTLNELWNSKQEETMTQLRRLHDRMGYLSRWIAQLKEMELQFKLRG